MFYGFGVDDDVIYAALPPKMASIVIDELRENPAIAPEIAKILSSKNPALTIAREISASAAEGMRAGLSGFSDFGLGKSRFKRFTKAVSNVAKNVQETVKDVGQKVQDTAKDAGQQIQESAKKVASYSSLPAFVASKTKFGQNVVAKVREAAKDYGPTALKIAGAVAAPFTGGASLSVTALIQAREQLQAQKRAVKDAEKAASADAAQMQQEANVQQAQLAAQVDDFFFQNIQTFAQFGITQDKWSTMTTEQKIDTIDKIASGQIPQIQQAPPPPTPSSPWGVGPSSPPPSSSAPASQGLFELYAEGQKIAEAMNAADIGKAIENLTKVGDRFEVLFNGNSTGLKVRTASGAVDVPPDQAATVSSMSTGQVQAAAAKASGGGVPWWLIAIPAAGYLALSK